MNTGIRAGRCEVWVGNFGLTSGGQQRGWNWWSYPHKYFGENFLL